MNKITSISRASWLAFSAFGLAFGAHVAKAQETGVVVQVDRSQIIVKAQTYGSVVKEVSLAQHVAYSDLDLTTETGRTALERRITVAARAVCRRLDLAYPGSKPSGASCTAISVQDAMRKVSGTTVTAAR